MVFPLFAQPLPAWVLHSLRLGLSVLSTAAFVAVITQPTGAPLALVLWLPWALWLLVGQGQRPSGFSNTLAIMAPAVGLAWALAVQPMELPLWQMGLGVGAWLLGASTLQQQRHHNLGLLRQQEALATTDALTGLMNRRCLMQSLEREMARSQRSGAPLSVALFDLDHFKAVNDLYGHAVGDLILKELSQLVAGNLRQSDLLARYGGEEFALILPDTPCLEARHLLERLRKLVETSLFCLPKHPMTITLSLGLTQYAPGHHQRETLLQEADTALYQAKGQGRNQVCAFGWASPVPPPSSATSLPTKPTDAALEASKGPVA